jgi:cytochrome oxidase Cu insertion factor (SCO1/SenC/PrrC family)
VRLATVSFDPAYDTPARMAALRDAMAPRSAWRFLTAESPEAIAPVLAAFGQDALPLVGRDEKALGLYRHVLKVFLVDAGGAVRNVYSSGFLSPELLLVDARTVLGAGSIARREE